MIVETVSMAMVHFSVIRVDHPFWLCEHVTDLEYKMTDLFFLFIILQCCLFLLFIYLFITKSLYFNSSKLLNHSISAWDGYQLQSKTNIV